MPINDELIPVQRNPAKRRKTLSKPLLHDAACVLHELRGHGGTE